MIIGLMFVAIFFMGTGYIVYSQRPAVNVDYVVVSAHTGGQNVGQETGTENQYTMETVRVHNSRSDCWSVINGGVYDLTSFVSRHPGGSKSITRMCGDDGSRAFNKEHGRDRSANSSLVSLKIGTLTQ